MTMPMLYPRPDVAEGLKAAIAELQATTDERLRQWVTKHYADLPSLPVAKGPVMVHHVPRFLSMRRGAGEAKIALLVFDGLAVDQWVQIREALAKRAPKLGFEQLCRGLRADLETCLRRWRSGCSPAPARPTR